MANKEFVDVLIQDVKLITADYKGDDPKYQRQVQRKRGLIFGIDVSKIKALKLSEEGETKMIEFPKRVDKQIYTTKETKEDYIYIDFSGKVTVLNEQTNRRYLGVIFDHNYPNAEYTHVDVKVNLSYNEAAGKYIARINLVRIMMDCVINEINNYTYDDESKFVTVNAEGEIIGGIGTDSEDAKLIEE